MGQVLAHQPEVTPNLSLIATTAVAVRIHGSGFDAAPSVPGGTAPGRNRVHLISPAGKPEAACAVVVATRTMLECRFIRILPSNGEPAAPYPDLRASVELIREAEAPTARPGDPGWALRWASDVATVARLLTACGELDETPDTRRHPAPPRTAPRRPFSLRGSAERPSSADSRHATSRNRRQSDPRIEEAGGSALLLRTDSVRLTVRGTGWDTQPGKYWPVCVCLWG